MAGSLLPEPKQQFLNDIGDPLFAGQIFTYAAGTLTPKATYQDQALTILNTNPVVANARGEVVMYGSGTYRIILKDLSGNTIYDRDNIETPNLASETYAASLALPSGSSKVGFESNYAASPSTQTVEDVLDREINLANYSGYDPTGVEDNASILQEAIDDAATRGVYKVKVIGKIRCNTAITLKPGVILDGETDPGYYAGMLYYAIPTNTMAGPKSRIFAGATIAGALIKIDPSSDNSFGFGIRNLIVDGNKLSDYCISSQPATLTERITRFANIIVQGGKLGGIIMSTVLVQFWDNVIVSSCGGFGVQFPFGVSDSQFKSLYIHTCDSGGIQIGTGSSNLHFFGGKIEDNYGNGIEVTSGVLIYLHGVSINANNGDAIVSNGGFVYGDGCAIFSNNVSLDSAAVFCSSGLVKLTGGVIYGNNYNFQQNGGTITIDGADIGNAVSANVIQTGGALSVIADTKSGIPAMRNPGGRRIAVSIGTSSSASITFVNALDGGMGPAYFDMKAYDLSVTYAQFPSSPDPAQSFIGQVIVGKTDTTVNAAVRVISASSAGYIASVAAAVSGSDIIITITTGATYGTGGGNTFSFVSLADIGHNIYH